MAGTYIDMITRIQDEMTNSSLSVAQIKNAILTSIADYENTGFFFNRTTSTMTTVAGQEYYAAADLSDIPNIVSFDSFQIAVNGYKRPVGPIDFPQMDTEQNGNISSVPYWYAYYKQKIRLYPNPDQAYTCYLAYQYKFAALSADSDTNAWMTDGEELIRQAAKRRLNADLLFDDMAAARCERLEDMAFETLQEETARRMPDKKLHVPAMTGLQTFNIYRGY